MDINIEAITCAARHFIAAHESGVSGQSVDFGDICAKCDLLPRCGAKWYDTAKPIFDAAGLHPMLLRHDRRDK